MINIYSDSSQLALKYLKDTEFNIHNIIIMIGNFNIRDSIWNSNFLFHSNHSDSLFDIADSFYLDISKPLKNVPTRFSNNDYNANSVLDLVFLHLSSPEFNRHHIHPNWRLSSDYALITVKVSICEERISYTWWLLAKGSDEENQFIENVIQIIKNVNMTIIQNTETFKKVIQSILSNIEKSWWKNSKPIKITRHSKAWWNKDYYLSLEKYRLSQSLENWHNFKSMVKKTKRSFFDNKIEEIANKKCGL